MNDGIVATANIELIRNNADDMLLLFEEKKE